MPQQVIDVRGESDAIVRNLAMLGQALGEIINTFSDSAQARKLAIEHPELAAMIARGQREQNQSTTDVSQAMSAVTRLAAPDQIQSAIQANTKSVAEQFGYRKGIGERLQALMPESSAEREERASRRTGLAEKKVTAAVAQAEAAPYIAKAASTQAQLTGGIAAELLNRGAVKSEADAQMIDTQLKQLRAEQQTEYLNIIKERSPRLSPDERYGMALAATNPEWLNYKIQERHFREQMQLGWANHDLQTTELNWRKAQGMFMLGLQMDELAVRKASGEAERNLALWRLKGDLTNQLGDVFQRIGDVESGKLPKNIMPALQAEVLNVANMQAMIDPGSMISILQDHEKAFGGKKYDWAAYVPGSMGDPRIGRAIAETLAGKTTLQAINADPDISPKFKATITRAVVMYQTQQAQALLARGVGASVPASRPWTMDEMVAGRRGTQSGHKSQSMGQPPAIPLYGPTPIGVQDGSLASYLKQLNSEGALQ